MVLVEGSSTDIGSSDVDAIFGLDASTQQIGPTGFFSGKMNIEMLPRE